MWRIPPEKSTLFNYPISFLQSPLLLTFVYFTLLCKRYGKTICISTRYKYEDINESFCDSDGITTRADDFVTLGKEPSKVTSPLSIQKRRMIEFGIPPDKKSPSTSSSTYLQERIPPDKDVKILPLSQPSSYRRLCGFSYYNVYS